MFRFYTHKKRAKNCGQSNTLKQAFSLKKHKFIAQKFILLVKKLIYQKNANFVSQKSEILCIKKGCTSCHNGVNLGGSMQAFEVAGKYKFASLGDFKGDKDGLVKTPTLRNVAETAPYFHNGAIWKLTDAIKEMGSIQLGIEISEAEAKSIEKFLLTLSGKKPTITYPQLPASTQNTPKPEL